MDDKRGMKRAPGGDAPDEPAAKRADVDEAAAVATIPNDVLRYELWGQMALSNIRAALATHVAWARDAARNAEWLLGEHPSLLPHVAAFGQMIAASLQGDPDSSDPPRIYGEPWFTYLRYLERVNERSPTPRAMRDYVIDQSLTVPTDVAQGLLVALGLSAEESPGKRFAGRAAVFEQLLGYVSGETSVRWRTHLANSMTMDMATGSVSTARVEEVFALTRNVRRYLVPRDSQPRVTEFVWLRSKLHNFLVDAVALPSVPAIATAMQSVADAAWRLSSDSAAWHSSIQGWRATPLALLVNACPSRETALLVAEQLLRDPQQRAWRVFALTPLTVLNRFYGAYTRPEPPLYDVLVRIADLSSLYAIDAATDEHARLFKFAATIRASSKPDEQALWRVILGHCLMPTPVGAQ